MESVNFAFLGRPELAATLGKKGTQTDLTLFDRKESGAIRTWVVPSGFPEKIQPLFQAVNLAEYAILHVDALDRYAGEQILVLDAAGRGRGILSHSEGVDHDTLLRAVRGTAVEGYDVVEPDDIRLAAAAFGPAPGKGGARVVVDHCFDVKGAGTIALGKVLSGSVSKHDTLRALPSGIDVLVKSIQMHDDPVETASSPARVGLALKGARPQEIGRGEVLCGSGAELQVSDEICLDFAKTPYYKGEPSVNQMCLLGAGLQVVAGKFASADPVVVKLDRPIACEPGDRCALLKPDSTSVRIMGSGKVL